MARLLPHFTHRFVGFPEKSSSSILVSFMFLGAGKSATEAIVAPAPDTLTKGARFFAVFASTSFGSFHILVSYSGGVRGGGH